MVIITFMLYCTARNMSLSWIYHGWCSLEEGLALHNECTTVLSRHLPKWAADVGTGIASSILQIHYHADRINTLFLIGYTHHA